MKYLSEEEINKYPPFLTTNEAAKLIRSTRQNVYNLIRDGKIHCLHIGKKKVLISRDIFLRDIESMNKEEI